MSHLHPGLIGAYNSLTDKHLTGYFNNARIRRHLQRVGLISRSGRIVSEKEFRYRIIHKDQQRHVRECLAQAIFHRVLDMERLHHSEIRRNLEECVRRERVNKVKVERCNRYEDDSLILLSPRPPTRLRNLQARHSGPEREPSDSTDSLDSSRPNTAPEKTQRPLRLKPLNSNSTSTSTKRNSSRYQDYVSTNDGKQQICSVLDGDVMRHLTLTDFSSSVSPYRLPVINNFVTPVPPLKRRDKVQNRTLRGRRLRPTTAPSDAPISKEGAVQRAWSQWSQTAVWVKMVYFGKSVHLSNDLMELKDEVKVFQQHCGGENLCVYKGRLKEGESFQFTSRRHRGFPFSLTFYLNGLQVERLSSCCEFKHRKNSRLGGRHAHFGFSGVEGATPCYRCIIAMGLDKKPAPPNRIRNNLLVSKPWEKEDEKEKPLQFESSQSHLTDPKRHSNQERKHNNGYEEDFEADDEGPMDDGVDKGNETSFNREEENERRTDGNNLKDSIKNQVRRSSVSTGLTSSLSSSEEDDFDKEQKEEEVRSKRHTPTSTSEKDGEEMDALPTSSVCLPTEDKTQNQEIEYTERNDREAEKSIKETGKNKEPGNAPGEDDKPRNIPGKIEEPKEEPEEAKEPRKETEEAEEPKIAEKSREEPEVAEDPKKEHKEAEKSKGDFREGMNKEINDDGAQVKSVQEKLAEAILNMNQCVSEPELSDTTTEEDELVSVETQRAGPDAESENNAAHQTPDEENGAELVQAAESEKEYTEEPKEETAAHETSQAETKTEEEEKKNNQIEEKTYSTANEDGRADDEQNLENKDHNTEVRQDTADKEGQIQEDDNFSNLQNKSNVDPENTEEPRDEEPLDEALQDGDPPGDELRDGDPPDDELPDGVRPGEELLDGETPDEEPPDKEVPNGDPPVKELLDGKPTNKELPKEAPTENSVNAEESRATPVENKDNVMEEITENTKESSENHGNVNQNTEIEKVNEEELGGGEELSVEEISDVEAKTFEEESGNLRNSSDETNIDTAKYVEGSMEDLVLNEVKDEDLAGEDKKSEERVLLSETVEEKEQIEEEEGNETYMRNAIDVIRDQDQVKEDKNTEEGNRDEEKINHGMTEDVADRNEPTPTGQTSNKRAENEVRKSEELEEEFIADNDAGLQEKQELGSEGKNTEEDKHKEELEKNKSFKEYEVEENEWHMSECEEVVGKAVEMQRPLTEQQEEQKEQIHGSDPSLNKTLQETTDGPEVKSGELIAENVKEVIIVDQGELDKKEGPGEEKGPFKSSEEFNQDMDEEAGVKAEQMDEDNEQVDQKEIQQEITNKEEKQEKEEEVVVGVKGNEQKQTVEKAEAEEKANRDQETISDREIKDEQKEEVENPKPLISESSNDTANEHQAPSDAKTPVEDPAGADSEPKDTNAEFEGRTEDEAKASPGSNIQSSTDIKKEKGANAAEETRRLEGSVSPLEESQPLEKVLAVKRDEREPELIVAPRTNHEELVSNWVIVHQASKYFETFVEPLDEIKINDGKRNIHTEDLEVDEVMQSPKDSEEKDESSEAAKDEQIILPVNSEHEQLQDTTVENLNMDAEALGAEVKHNWSSGNPSEETEDRRQMNSVLTPEDEECVDQNNGIDISATSLMKNEISQDS
ncbi:glutamate-rich protein 3 [Clarias gariepinus]